MQGGELVVNRLGAGAQDWFAHAPWDVCSGVLLRELVHMDHWPSLQLLKDALHAGSEIGDAHSPNGKMVLDMQLSHFQTSKYICEHVQLSELCADKRHRSMGTVEYVCAKVEATFSNVLGEMMEEGGMMQGAAVVGNGPVSQSGGASSATKSAADRSHALLLFNLPESWQWVPSAAATPEEISCLQTPRQPADGLGQWMHKDDVNASVLPTLEELVGSAHEFMGVFKLDRRQVSGLEDWDAAAPVAQPGLEGVSSLMFDPMPLLDVRDQVVMQSVVTSIGRMACSRSGSPEDKPDRADSAVTRCLRRNTVTDCMELHSGIVSTSLGDMLKLWYRLKLPHAMGGYESAWRPLWSHTLNASAVSAVRLACGACAARAPFASRAFMPCGMDRNGQYTLPAWMRVLT